MRLTSEFIHVVMALSHLHPEIAFFKIQAKWSYIPMGAHPQWLHISGELWAWRIVPVAGGDAWHSGNMLQGQPGDARVVQNGGEELHGRDFHLLEPHGTVVQIMVDIWKAWDMAMGQY